MLERNNYDLCTMCRKKTEYTFQKKDMVKVINGKEYSFKITVAICNECGEEMSVPGLIDRNIKEVDEQYRTYEGIISIDDIEKLMEIYKLGKDPLSLALGFGEITIRRYLSGQIPSKEYSNIIKFALSSPSYMKKKLYENRGKLSPVAFNKAIKEAERLEKLFSISEKMLCTISYLFEKMYEITPLALQKLLYYIQGVSYALNNKPMFNESCQAWVHGPVYREVYDIFKDFKYSPIDDVRFAVFTNRENVLTEEEYKVIDLVVDTFGIYSAKTLELITHNETPWLNARVNYEDDMPSNEPISFESISEYFEKQNVIYNFSTREGLENYINDALHSMHK